MLGYIFTCVCFSLARKITQKLWTDFSKLSWKGGAKSNDQSLQSGLF